MSEVSVHITYPHLSNLIKEETNKRSIVVKSMPIRIDDIAIQYHQGQLWIFADIHSRMKAGLDFKFKPNFDQKNQLLSISVEELKFKTKNLLLQGALTIIKSRIISEIEKISSQPISTFKPQIIQMLDQELNKAAVPEGFEMDIVTKDIQINDLEFDQKGIKVNLDLSQKINISSLENQTSLPDQPKT